MKKPLSVATLFTIAMAFWNPCAAQEMMAGEKAAPPIANTGAVATPAKTMSRTEEILKRFDKNGDGRLDDDEKADAHDVMLQEQMAKEAPPASVQSLAHFQELALELFDRNHDGRIDEAEQTEATAFLERGDVGVTRETLLTRFDTSRDGKLDDNERREAQAYAVEHRGELMREVLLKRYDANGNGQLEPEEKMAVRAAWMSTLVSAAAVLEEGSDADRRKKEASAAVERERALREKNKADDAAAPKKPAPGSPEMK